MTDRTANIGITTYGEKGWTLRNTLMDMLEKKEKEAGNIQILRQMCGITPVSPPIDNPCAKGIIAIGSCAKLVDPLTGEGIYYAVKSGITAGEAIIKAINLYNDIQRAGALYRRDISDLVMFLNRYYDNVSGSFFEMKSRVFETGYSKEIISHYVKKLEDIISTLK